MFTVGIVGYGVVGQRRHKTLQQFEHFKVVAVSDKTFSEDTAPKNLKWYSDFKDLSTLFCIKFIELSKLVIFKSTRFATFF